MTRSGRVWGIYAIRHHQHTRPGDRLTLEVRPFFYFFKDDLGSPELLGDFWSFFLHLRKKIDLRMKGTIWWSIFGVWTWFLYFKVAPVMRMAPPGRNSHPGILRNHLGSSSTWDTINSVKLGFCIPVGRSQLGNPSSYGFLWIPWASQPGPINLSHRSYWKVDRQILGLAVIFIFALEKDSKKRTHFYL